jgi:hypothetical protein
MAEAQHNKEKIMKKNVDDAAGKVAFLFKEGQSIEVNLEQLNADIQRRAALHGLAQKIGDAAAGKKGDDAYEACMGVYERIIAGEWQKATEKGESRPSMVIEAIFRALTKGGKNPVMADLQAKYTGEGAEERRKAALSNPQVKAEYAALQAEAAQARAAKAMAAAETAPDLADL